MIIERQEEFERSHNVNPHINNVSDSLILSHKKSNKLMSATDKITIINSERNEMNQPRGRIKEKRANHTPYDKLFYANKNGFLSITLQCLERNQN